MRKRRSGPGDKRPTFASVTVKRCTCKNLDWAAAEPGIPISFDERMNEFRITHNPTGGQPAGYSVIYHCPFCGGRARRSKRPSFFALLTQAEVRRLQRLTEGIATPEQAIERLGKPSLDSRNGVAIITPGSRRVAPRAMVHRQLTFDQVSQTADVVLVDYGGAGGVRFTFVGKYLGGGKREV